MNFKNIILYESDNYHNFYPFEIMHPIWEIRVGNLRIFEKVQKIKSNSKLYFVGRKNHKKSFLERFNLNDFDKINGNCLFINSQVIPNQSFFDNLNFDLNRNYVLILKEKIIGFYLTDILNFDFKDEIIKDEKIENLNLGEIELNSVDYLNYLYDALDYNAKEINNDYDLLKNIYEEPDSENFPAVQIINSDNIIIGNNVQISPGVVIDASESKVIIENNVKIMPNATIIAPFSIGNNSIIKIGAKIYEENSFGEWCKVGGEIENTIIQSYSNKQHEGFLGHSYICEWVNLGADTNNSDLKNTYSNIKIRLRNEIVDTERMFLGLLCGDHTKSSINAMFTTGTTAGICGIIVRDWFMPNFINSFSWGGKSDSPIYKFEKALETAKIVMKRRNRDLSDTEILLMKEEYDKIKS